MKDSARLRRNILDRQAGVAIVGQGYVGLSLACAAASEGFRVTGIDVDPIRVRELNRGELTVPGVPDDLFAEATATRRMRFSTSTKAIRTSDVILICVPTPLRDGVPDLTYVDNVVASRDFLLAYSPERIDPGNEVFGLRNTPKVVGGCTPAATTVATLFYGQLVDKVVAMSSARAAELAKLLENTFRHVNIGLVNELAMLCHEMGIDVWEVVEAASTKPFGFMPFYPGPGVGGHCIPLDPAYLAWQVRRDVGRRFRILEQAEDVNAMAPAYVTDRIANALNERGRAVKRANILVLGVAYKPDVGDLRESPSLNVVERLRRRGARVSYHDPFVRRIETATGILHRTDLSRRAIAAADCVALLTPHSAYDLGWIADSAALIFDAQNAYGPDRRANVERL